MHFKLKYILYFNLKCYSFEDEVKRISTSNKQNLMLKAIVFQVKIGLI